MQAIAPLTRAVKTIAGTEKILTSSLPQNMRLGILRSYLANELRGAALKTGVRREARFEVFDWQVECLDENAFLSSFAEIFVDLCYVPTTTSRTPLIIDGGSNIGLSVLFFKRLYPEATILAFEPDRDAFTCLSANVGANDIQGISLYERALSDQDGETEFFFDPDQPGSRKHSIVAERVPVASRRVQAAKLSTFIEQEIDFLKLDIEGAETQVLSELRTEDKLRQVREMAIEYHHHIVETDDSLSEMLALLEDAGFGYELSARSERPLSPGRTQDLLIYAYRKLL